MAGSWKKRRCFYYRLSSCLLHIKKARYRLEFMGKCGVDPGPKAGPMMDTLSSKLAECIRDCRLIIDVAHLEGGWPLRRKWAAQKKRHVRDIN